PNHIDPNISFLLDGVEEYTTGNIPKTEEWITHGFTFTTAPGQTSVILSLRNNAPGGIGNDLGLDNITFRACGPQAQILPETVERICEDGQFTTLSATITGDQYATPAVQWQRSLDEGITWEDIPGENSLDFVHTELASGFYYYRYLLANGPSNLDNNKCRVVSNVKVVEVVPKFYELSDTLCSGLSYVSGEELYDQSGIYIDTFISSIGCDSIVTLNLVIIPDPGITPELSITNPFCSNDLGSIQITSVQNGNPPYLYRFAGDTLSSNSIFPDLDLGTFAIEIIDRFGCSADTNVIIEEPPIFLIDLGSDQIISLGETATINVLSTTPVASTSWEPAFEMCDTLCLLPRFTPRESNFYVLTATSEAGCTSTDSVRISVLPTRQVYIPNAFSPNDDGINDRFKIYSTKRDLTIKK
ncbi:MAG: hypothetical protein AAFU03_16935, partial [Bacteroidota bacterium]